MLKTPPLQTATATIETLCGRLQSATLLEDRRAAILGLRSFAKQYPASVASGSLRELISILKRDGLGESASTNGESRRSQEGGDVDTIRLVLETLLMLFNPDSASPEAGDEINFFMADELSMRQDNMTLLLSLLDPTSPYADYYSRLYSVQILSAVCAVRPERVQECILSAPLGVSRLVGVLDDARDAIRSAGLLLLVDLTGGANEELRKIVAFEDVFVKIFGLIRLEGGLAEAGITAQDCLSLLANLVKGSTSNQTMFRESTCVAEYVQLLQQAFPQDASEAAYMAQSREKAAWGLLQLLKLFFVPGEASTAPNQVAFFKAGAAQLLIDLGFSHELPPAIRTSALRSAAALIDSNAPLQEQFASLTVASEPNAEENVDLALKTQQSLQVNGSRSSAASAKNSARPSADIRRVYIIEALLDLALIKSEHDVALRVASCTLVQAYLTKHDRIRAHFLQRAIAGHVQHEEAANALASLLHPPTGDVVGVVLASWIVQDLIADNVDAKATLAEVKEGNEDEGEDVLTFIQTLGSQLLVSLQQSLDERVVAAYASLLITLLWEFAPGVDNLLAEGSSLMQSLLNVVKDTTSHATVAGVAAALLGTIYEFSTKDSPIPRRTLAPLLQQKLDRSKYLGALLELRRLPSVRDLDLAMESDEAGEDMLSQIFVELYCMEYTRLRKAIDKDPGVEVLPPSAVEAGVDRDILDDLRQQIQSLKDALDASNKEVLETRQKSEQDRMAVAKELQTSSTEAERLRKINQSIQQGHEKETENIKKQHENESEKLKKSHEAETAKLKKQHEQQKQASAVQQQRAVADARLELERQTQATLRERDASSAQKIQELERKAAELGNAHRTESNGHAAARQQLDTLTAKHNELLKRERDISQRVEELQRLHGTADRELQVTTARAIEAESKLESLQSSFDARNDETNTIKTQLKELQEELKGRDEELKAERAGFADLEKELEAAKATAAKAASASAKSGKADNKQVKKLEGEVKEAKENEKSAKDELESMLLVMGDIEAKRDAYKAKVKELGGEVTDDDEDEDEEDEDEDDVD